MKKAFLVVSALTAMFLLAFQVSSQEQPQSSDGAKYTNDGQMLWPEQYAKWVHVGSGIGMAYNPSENDHGASDPPFTDIYVNPSAYDSFAKTGRWPDKTTMVVEVRKSLSKGSINQGGHYEGALQGLEVHVKDESRFKSKWGFYGFGVGTKSAKLIPDSASCYSCHSDHGAVDTTFVQFYPSLLEIATQRGTLQPDHADGADKPKKQDTQNTSPKENPNAGKHETEAETEAIDPMCDMKVNVSTALKSTYKGKTYYFCQDSCKRGFDAEPEKYANEASK